VNVKLEFLSYMVTRINSHIGVIVINKTRRSQVVH
jgi:hypothetical protein